MHEKVVDWLNTKGRRLAELNVVGNKEIFDDSDELDGLSPEEAKEYLYLNGQLDMLIWLFCPKEPNEALSFISDITEIVCNFEKDISLIQKITGMKYIVIGCA